MTLQKRFSSALMLAALVLAGSALAQGYPSKSVRIVVPFPAGGSVHSSLAGSRNRLLNH